MKKPNKKKTAILKIPPVTITKQMVPENTNARLGSLIDERLAVLFNTQLREQFIGTFSDWNKEQSAEFLENLKEAWNSGADCDVLEDVVIIRKKSLYFLLSHIVNSGIELKKASNMLQEVIQKAKAKDRYWIETGLGRVLSTEILVSESCINCIKNETVGIIDVEGGSEGV